MRPDARPQAHSPEALVDVASFGLSPFPEDEYSLEFTPVGGPKQGAIQTPSRRAFGEKMAACNPLSGFLSVPVVKRLIRYTAPLPYKHEDVGCDTTPKHSVFQKNAERTIDEKCWTLSQLVQKHNDLEARLVSTTFFLCQLN
ncbi:unnamed protein product [Echinostoma caproni]|uniref:BLOC-1-related complex subunit 5 n=1 Tax=Echinostoma caproni TaxID=27848 RepID=A0A183AT65_9TREM|nr:unnamed protein product [Echinostoma caproni]